jgi:DNA-binding MarR family transcriptional regulator
MNPSEKELEILENIYNSTEKVRQRDLAHIAGLSLGMTNSILKRLAKKGLITIKKVNNRNIQYAVSPVGMEEIAKRSYRYFRRTIKNVAYYKESIESIISQVAEEGYEQVVLIGGSDLDFIVEHLCGKYGIGYTQRKMRTDNPNWYFLYSENQTPSVLSHHDSGDGGNQRGRGSERGNKQHHGGDGGGAGGAGVDSARMINGVQAGDGEENAAYLMDIVVGK